MKKTVVKITKSCLEDLLHIPTNVEIENIALDRTEANSIMIILEGEGLPGFTEVEEGGLISMSEIMYTKNITNEFKKVG